MNQLYDILNLEGIIIRHIPEQTTSMWSYREGDENKLKDNQEIVVKDGRKFVKQVNKNKLAGYAVSFDMGQGSTIMFSKKWSGFGSTIESAYDDFIGKQGQI